MKVGDLVRIKPSLLDCQPNRVLLVQKVFEHRMTLWVKLLGAKYPHVADHFEVVSEAINESR